MKVKPIIPYIIAITILLPCGFGCMVLDMYLMGSIALIMTGALIAVILTELDNG